MSDSFPPPPRPAPLPPESLLQREHRSGYHREVKPADCAECWPSGTTDPPREALRAAASPAVPPVEQPKGHERRRGEGWEPVRGGLERVRSRVRVDAEAPPELPPGVAADGLPTCETCLSRRWLRRDVLPTDPAFGQAIPCPDCAAGPLLAARVGRVFSSAGIPPRFASSVFETYPVSPATRDPVRQIREWAEWGQRGASLLIYGPYSVGKTGLAVSALRLRLERAPSSSYLFLPTLELLDALRFAYDPRREHAPPESAVILGARTVGVLLLDDLGAERPNEWVRDRLYAVLNYRHDHLLPTIYTSNLDPPELANHLGERTAWRLLETCRVVALMGPELR